MSKHEKPKEEAPVEVQEEVVDFVENNDSQKELEAIEQEIDDKRMELEKVKLEIEEKKKSLENEAPKQVQILEEKAVKNSSEKRNSIAIIERMKARDSVKVTGKFMNRR